MELKIYTARIQELMESRGLKAGQVAYKSDLAVQEIYHLLKNQRPNATAVTIAKLARGLDTTVDYLLGLSDNPLPRDETIMPSNDVEYRILELFRLLPETLQDVASEMLSVWLDHRDAWPEEDNRRIPGDSLPGSSSDVEPSRKTPS